MFCVQIKMIRTVNLPFPLFPSSLHLSILPTLALAISDLAAISQPVNAESKEQSPICALVQPTHLLYKSEVRRSHRKNWKNIFQIVRRISKAEGIVSNYAISRRAPSGWKLSLVAGTSSKARTTDVERFMADTNSF